MSADVRPAPDVWLGRVLARLLSCTPVTPNQLTLVGLLVALVAAALLLRGDYWSCLAGMLLFAVRGVLDHADGTLARLKNCCSEFGYRLDYACDTLSLGCLVLAAGFGQAASLGPHAVWLGIVGSVGCMAVYLVLFVWEARLGKELVRWRFQDRYESDDLLYLLPLFALADAMPLFLWLTAVLTPCVTLVLILVPGRAS